MKALTDEMKCAYRDLALAAKRVQELEAGISSPKPTGFDNHWRWIVWMSYRQFGFRWHIEKEIPPLPFADVGVVLDVDDDGCFEEIESVSLNTTQKVVHIHLGDNDAGEDDDRLYLMSYIRSGWKVFWGPFKC